VAQGSSYQRQAPFGRIGPRRRILLDLAGLHPVVRIAHRLRSAMRIRRRIIFDHELVLIAAGQGQWQWRGRTEAFGAGDLFLVEPFVPHAIESAGGRPCEHLAVHFDLAPGVPPGPPGPPEPPHPRRLDRRKPYRVVLPKGLAWPPRCHLPAGHRIAQGLAEVVRAFGRPDDLASVEASAKLMLVLAELLRQDRDPPTGINAADARNRLRLNRVLRLIDAELSRPLAVADLAREAGLSTPHVGRLFRQWTGQSPMAYLRRQRIERARQLLAEVDLSIKEVAAKVGFDDPYHFSRAFRQIDGLSPSDFRAAALAGRDP
jgi:AraC-like DNA-binding protein